MAVSPRSAMLRRLVIGATLALSIGALGSGVDAAAPASDVTVAGTQNDVSGATLVAPHALGARMLVSLVLAPRNGAQLSHLIVALQDKKSPQYHHWLKTGAFNRRFAPASSVIGAARAFLAGNGLHLEHSPSPFLVRATGTTAQVQAAFATSIDDYVDASGMHYFSNAQAAHVPATLAHRVLGVTGLASTVRLHPQSSTAPMAASEPDYGAGPGGSGLTPSQLEGIYSAGTIHAQSNGKGQGTELAVFELSGYTKKDITAYEDQFFGPSVRVPVQNINVDGGPVTPDCPGGDICGPFNNGSCFNGCDSADYSGDVEVESDIEVQIAMAPGAAAIMVYNAPNDGTGTTTLDELFQIADDNIAEVVSSSWGLCEPHATASHAQAEAVAFAQMASQGQSFFAATGDNGAYDCLGDSHHKAVNVDDPPSQPHVTAVGGTSMGTFNPGSNASPSYPAGKESVWNPNNKCHGTATNPGADCRGEGGGGVSRFWARPGYQKGPGTVSTGFTQKSPYCSLAASGKRCRELPDISAVADSNTPYAIRCTGAKTTTGAGASYCKSALGSENVSGWLGVGGTSLSTPLVSAIIDLSDSFNGGRFGEANVVLYAMFNSPGAYGTYFHDIVATHVAAKTNGYYPSAPNYDMATGIGTPIASAIAMAAP